MKNNFYNHILKIEPARDKLFSLELEDIQKKDLLDLLHSHIHITIIDVILSELDEDKKKEFLHLVVVKGDDSAAWAFVLTHIEKGEDKIKEVIDRIVTDFIRDLEE